MPSPYYIKKNDPMTLYAARMLGCLETLRMVGSKIHVDDMAGVAQILGVDPDHFFVREDDIDGEEC
jgi:hypothetical protein